MSDDADLTKVDSHFAFGRNWASFAEQLTEGQIADAVAGLQRLLPDAELADKTMIDIGCGSGLSMLAALRLGARRVVGVDIDPDSVETARSVLTRHVAGGSTPWDVNVASVFDLTPTSVGRFDVVYSWGVLHHTGAMRRAVECAGSLVAPGGTFVVALYQRTRCCGFWAREKRFYTSSPAPVQAAVRGAYKTATLAGVLVAGRSPVTYVREYGNERGMDFHHDVHDWLGGYPYESIDPADAEAMLAGMGFDPVRSFVYPIRLGGALGTPCAEYVVRRPQETA